MFSLMAATSEFEIGSGPSLIGGVIGLLIAVFLAYKCASNGRWLLFILGFFCGLFWIIGWALGRKDPGYR